MPGCTGASGLCDQMNGVDAPAAPDAAVPALRTCAATATTDPPGTLLQTAEHVDTPDTVVMTPPPAPSVPEAPETTMTRSAFNGKGTATATATSHGQNTKAACTAVVQPCAPCSSNLKPTAKSRPEPPHSSRQCELVRSYPRCARRARLYLRLALRARPRRSRASLAARDRLSHPRHMTCLLYTSDAADE